MEYSSAPPAPSRRHLWSDPWSAAAASLVDSLLTTAPPLPAPVSLAPACNPAPSGPCTGLVDYPSACDPDPLTRLSVSNAVDRPCSPVNWLSMALASAVGLHESGASAALGIGKSELSSSAGSSPLAGDSSSGTDSAGGGPVLAVHAADAALMSTSRHSSDSGHSSTNSRDVSVFGSPSCLPLSVGLPAVSAAGPASVAGSAAVPSLGPCDAVSPPSSLSATGLFLPTVSAASGLLCSDQVEQRWCCSSRRASSSLDAACGLCVGPTVEARWGSRCPLHHQAELTMLCNTCQLPLCYTCALQHASHSLELLPVTDTGTGAGAVTGAGACRRALLGRSTSVRQQGAALLRAVGSAQQRAADVGATLRQRAARARLETAAVCDQLRAALTAAQQRLERKATAVCQLKLSRLQQQCERLELLRVRVLQLMEDTQLGEGGGVEPGTAGVLQETESDAERLVRCVMADQQLRDWLVSAPLSPVEDATLRYVATSSEAATAALMLACGRLESSGCAEQSRLAANTALPLLVGRAWQALLSVRDHYGDERQAPAADAVEVHVVGPDGRPLACHVQQLSACNYRLSCVPQQPGLHRFALTVNGASVLVEGAGVWSQRAVVPRPLSTLGPAPRLVVGGAGESSAPGRFCRPWGVAFSAACEQQLLAVSDRSNHRVQLFSVSDGRLLLTFGQLGERCGELNRPAGLAFSPAGDQLVVADKDNHRVQVFTCDGRFIFKFGEKGSRPGMFNYPWDVACNSQGQIAVSDTRNHRVQLFTADGVFLKKFSQDGADWKELDSPRGLVFHPDGRLFITDFNNHRVVALHIATGHMSFIGREGSEPCRFLRPQGITVDDEGRLYVSDCRNSRVQVLTPAGEFLLQLGGQAGAAPGQFDQPQGVAVCAGSGLLAVVCLENHRVQVF